MLGCKTQVWTVKYVHLGWFCATVAVMVRMSLPPGSWCCLPATPLMVCLKCIWSLLYMVQASDPWKNVWAWSLYTKILVFVWRSKFWNSLCLGLEKKPLVQLQWRCISSSMMVLEDSMLPSMILLMEVFGGGTGVLPLGGSWWWICVFYMLMAKPNCLYAFAKAVKTDIVRGLHGRCDPHTGISWWIQLWFYLKPWKCWCWGVSCQICTWCWLLVANSTCEMEDVSSEDKE